MKKVLSVVLCIIMALSVFTIVPIGASASENFTFNPEAAIQFAKEHCEIDAERFPNNKARCTQKGVAGEWLCAEFVYKCLVAGGYKKTTNYNEKVPYTLGLDMLANGALRINCKKRVNQSIYMSDFDSKLSKGDVIIILYTNNPSGSNGQGHALIYSGDTDNSGRIKVYGHNNRKQNETYVTSAKTCSIYALHLMNDTYEDLGDNFYATITNKNNGKPIENQNDNVVLGSNEPSERHVWKFYRNGDGSYNIVTDIIGRRWI